MGVSGAGKTTIAKALAMALGWEFVEGDDFHPADNIDKMKKNIALEDADRWPWLSLLNQHILRCQKSKKSIVVSCSALKKSYRQALMKDINSIEFAYLCGDPELIMQRISSRKNHFMKPGLLESQLQTLEVPEDALIVPIDLSIGDQVNFIRQHFNL